MRCDAAAMVAGVGRESLGVESGNDGYREPADREQLLAYVGAAAGCNGAPLVEAYVEGAGQRLGLSGDELREALEIAETVKEHAAEFFRRDAGRLTAKATPAGQGAWASCCQPAATAGAEVDEVPCGCQPPATAPAAGDTGAARGCQTACGQTE